MGLKSIEIAHGKLQSQGVPGGGPAFAELMKIDMIASQINVELSDEANLLFWLRDGRSDALSELEKTGMLFLMLLAVRQSSYF